MTRTQQHRPTALPQHPPTPANTPRGPAPAESGTTALPHGRTGASGPTAAGTPTERATAGPASFAGAVTWRISS
ncbi:hypothetical protein V5O46_29600, partial [Streptomyces sp. C6-003]